MSTHVITDIDNIEYCDEGQKVTLTRETTCEAWNWRFVFNADPKSPNYGHMMVGLELAPELHDQGSSLAEWALNPERKIGDEYKEKS